MAKNLIKILVYFLTFAAEKCVSQIFRTGYCNVVNPVPVTINIPPFGVSAWYEYARASGFTDPGTICTRYNFAPVVAQEEFTLAVTGQNAFTGKQTIATSLVRILGTVAENVLQGSLRVTVTNPFIGNRRSLIYSVVGSDGDAQDAWMVLYACEDFLIGKLEDVIILASSGDPDPSVIASALESAIETGISPTDIKLTPQTGCV